MVAKKTPVRRKTAAKTPVRRRRTPVRRKGMLSELFNPVMAQAGGKAVLSGAVGGAAAGLLVKVLPDTLESKTKSMYMLAGGFVFATVMKMPNVGAGMAGVGMYQLLTESGFLADDGVEYADPIEALPLTLNDDGMAYLQESDYLQEGDYLQEDYDVGYYGSGFGMDNYNF